MRQMFQNARTEVLLKDAAYRLPNRPEVLKDNPTMSNSDKYNSSKEVNEAPVVNEEEMRSPSPLPDENEWRALVERLRLCKEKHGSCIPTSRSASNLELAAWIKNLRAQYKFLQLNTSASAFAVASSTSHRRPSPDILKHRQGGGEGRGTRSFPILTWERVKHLEDVVGFEWTVRAENDATWRSRFEELKEYKETHGDTLVPARYEENSVLGHWCMTQRRQFTLLREGKPSTLSSDRFKLLESIGFSWVNRQDPEEVWHQRFKELKEYKEKHGNCLVPQKYPENPQLGIWVNTQRRHYKSSRKDNNLSMTPERIRLLESVGFQWSAIRSVPASSSSPVLSNYSSTSRGDSRLKSSSVSPGKRIKEEGTSGEESSASSASSRHEKKKRYDDDQECEALTGEPAKGQGLNVEEALRSIRSSMSFSTSELSSFAAGTASMMARPPPPMFMPVHQLHQSQPFYFSSSHFAATKRFFPSDSLPNVSGSPLTYTTVVPQQVVFLPTATSAAPAGASSSFGHQLFICDICGVPYPSSSYMDANAHRVVCAARARSALHTAIKDQDARRRRKNS